MMDGRAFSTSLLAGVAALLTSARGMAANASPTKARNVVLLHGLFADGSCWSEVIARLQAAGLNATAPPSGRDGHDSDDALLRRQALSSEVCKIEQTGIFNRVQLNLGVALPHTWENPIEHTDVELPDDGSRFRAGIDTDEETFKGLPDTISTARRPHCKQKHSLRTS